jgi:RimJ/RimL family protein N-acetyltransferase
MGSVFLRALEVDDLERTYQWHNDSDLYQSLTGTFRYVSQPAEEEWLSKKQGFSTREVSLAICLSGDSEHIGNIYLNNVDWVARHASVGVFIGNSDQHGKGYGQAAMRSLIKHAFEDLGLLRLYLFVLEDNKPAIRLYEKCGFVTEGRLRKHAFKSGKHKDVLVMGLCADD